MQPLISSEPPRPPATSRCDVGLVFALSFESGAFADCLANRVNFKTAAFTLTSGWLQGRKITMLNSGAGCEAASQATETLIAGHRPAWLISCGFAGGLQPELRRNDRLLANAVGRAGAAEIGDIPITLPEKLARFLESAAVHRGKILTGDKIVNRAADKRLLGQRSGALAVDMETLAVAEVCQRLAQPLISIRVISDAMDDELPADLDRLMSRTSGAQRFGAAMGALFHRPSSIKDLWKLHETAIEASTRLAKFLVEAIVQLVPRDSAESRPD